MSWGKGLQMVGNCIELYRAYWLSTLARLVSLPGDGVLAPIALVLLTAGLIFFVKKDRLFATILVTAALVGNLVKTWLKSYYQIPRPEAFGCDVMSTYGDIYSFPSGHTTVYTIFFGLMIYYAVRNWQELWAKFVLPISILMILSVGYSRIYLGAHWYLDVLAAYLLGGAIVAISVLIYEYVQKRSKKCLK